VLPDVVTCHRHCVNKLQGVSWFLFFKKKHFNRLLSPSHTCKSRCSLSNTGCIGALCRVVVINQPTHFFWNISLYAASYNCLYDVLLWPGGDALRQ
jgi:hypothetical protein